MTSRPHAKPSVRELIRALETNARFGANITTVHELPPSAPRFGPWPERLSARVRDAAKAVGVSRPYVHQAEALQRCIAGESVAVSTGTASGKSLCYQLPTLQAREQDPEARVLMLFPTKALARDQLAALAEWEDALAGLSLHASAYDGDTAASARPGVRRHARVMATNPDMLHAGILPHHARWSSFFANLALVVVDEMHVYRGVFGSHVANVLRRLRRVCRFHGSDPRFVLTSATIANPADLAAELIGRPVHVVDDDGSPRGRRTLVFYNPPVVDARLNIRRSSLLETEALARHFIEGGVQTIVFARSRQATELVVRYIGDGLAKTGREVPVVRGYRGGYTPSERRAVEAALRSGDVRGVVATNALELGIDIGQLDACIMAGYPGTIASTRQQSGRAGRRTEDSVAVLVASSSPLDQFIARHPSYVLGRSPEQARLDADNLVILLDHVRCAAFELPFSDAEAARPFGLDAARAPAPDGLEGDAEDGGRRRSAGEPGERSRRARPPSPPLASDVLAVLEGQGVVKHANETWYWLAEAYPSREVGLRSAGPDSVSIVSRRGRAPGVEHALGDAAEADRPQDAGWDVLGTVERATAQVYLHPGAIYLHDGVTYRVESLDWDEGRAVVGHTEPATYTSASSRTEIRPTRVDGSRSAQGADVSFGEVEVTTRVTGFREVRFHTHETVGWKPLDLPERTLRTGAYWFTLRDETVDRLRAAGRWHGDDRTSRGPNWGQQRDRARARDGYRCTVCGASERPGRQHDVHHIRPFSSFDFVKGQNEAYRAANELDNLVTLCAACHRRAERAIGLHGGLSGVGHALRHVSALHLMCDPRDIDVSATTLARWTGHPTVAVYERVSAGVGFAPALYDLHERIVSACAELIDGCPCADGCPACVGPVAEVAEPAPSDKAHALDVLRALGA